MKIYRIAKTRKINFPSNEWEDIKERLSMCGHFFTTRISNEYDKYKLGEKLDLPWGGVVVVSDSQKYEMGELHPFANELTKEQLDQIEGYDFQILKLNAVSN